MNKNVIITISRQFGSNGREIGRQLAEYLDIGYYNKEIMEVIANDFGINPDWNCPMEGGAFIPDCGSIAKLIEASTGRFPEFFGKPSKHTLDYIIQETGYEPDEIAIVGDRLYTDIAVADQSDVTSILVLSGESTREDVKTSDVKPNVILEDLSEITKML
mgnify:CR=1 FL=1